MASSTGTILITGGSGKVGSSLADLCQSSSIPYLLAHRSSSSSTPSTGHPTVKFDWTDRTTWSSPFTTSSSKTSPITAVFLVAPAIFDSSPILNDFIDLARTQHGVKRFVLLSASVVEAGGPSYGATAKYLQDLGGQGEIGFGIMRPTWFMDNWSEQHNLRGPIREEGKVYSAAGGGKIPWVSKTDIAACAFQALTAEKAPNGDYIILGPDLLSYGDVSLCADILTEITGKKIIHKSVTAEELANNYIKTMGLSEVHANFLGTMDVMIKNGLENRLNDVVLSVTGKKPKTFREFAQEHRDAWV
ncbi:Agroclavine dehydrogenase [Cytospora mali]|uniref:Agroclavine dehydrogenase n=1 Tax=Cytospora mali TaxID=578113 RepID=A0A194W4D5_CYTMA|nr:Agroclavine dehydrogenase [Valsa mali]